MTLRVVVAARAQRDLAEIDRWRRENRPAAPDLFLEEFAAALQMVSHAPFVGRRYRDTRIPNVRRLLMRATRCHVYYVLTAEEVVVHSAWSAVRGAGPHLGA